MPKPRKTKIATIAAMLMRPSGASLEAICKATGWQAHSVRAALTGLRKKGYAITLSDADDGRRAYRATPPTSAPVSATERRS